MNDIHPELMLLKQGCLPHSTLYTCPLKAIKMYLKYSAGNLVYLFTKLQSLTQDFKVSPRFEGLYFSIQRNILLMLPLVLIS